MRTRNLTLIITLAFLGFSGFAEAHRCQGSGDSHKHCAGEPGAGPIEYTAELISGAFKFHEVGKLSTGKVIVTTTSKEIGLLGNVELVMSRLEGDSATTWNQVFNTCGELLQPDSVPGFTADDWSIEKPGGVRVIFYDINLPGVGGLPGGEVTVQLIGEEFDSFLPADPGPDSGTSTSITHDLDWFAIYGRTQKSVHPKKGCQPSGSGGFEILPLLSPSKLEIIATRQ